MSPDNGLSEPSGRRRPRTSCICKSGTQRDFVWVDNSAPLSAPKRSRQGGTFVVRSHVSRLRKHDKIVATTTKNHARSDETKINTRSEEVSGRASSDSDPSSHPRCTIHTRGKANVAHQQLVSGQVSQRLALDFKTLKCDQISHIELLGRGNLDPFGTFPMSNASSKMHEFANHSVFYVAPKLVPDMEALTTFRNLSLQAPSFFHSLVYSGCVNRRAITTGIIDINAPDALQHKVLAIQELARAVKDPKTALTDSVVLTILLLGIHERLAIPTMDPGPFDSPLRTEQSLHIYGLMDRANTHMKALKTVMDLRGGIESCTDWPFFWFIIINDATISTNAMVTPLFDCFPRIRHKIDYIRAWYQDSHIPADARLSTGFIPYRDRGIHTFLMYILRSMAALTSAIKAHLRHENMSISLVDIVDARMAIQHSFLALPSLAKPGNVDLDQKSKSGYIYDPVRLTTRIYSIAVLVPLPNSRHSLQKLVSQLKFCIKQTPQLYKDENAHIFLWILVVGGIAAVDKVERSWFVEELARYGKVHDMTEWEEVEDIMQEFLWMNSACGRGGKAVWEEALKAP